MSEPAALVVDEHGRELTADELLWLKKGMQQAGHVLKSRCALIRIGTETEVGKAAESIANMLERDADCWITGA